MELQLGKNYALYTNKNTLSGEKVTVVGIRAYSQIRDIPFDVGILALGEKVVFPSDAPIESLFFYHCVAMTDPNSHFLVWADIIDGSRTTLLGAQYGYSLTISINPNSDANISDVLNRMQAAILAQFGVTVQLNFAQSFVGQADEAAMLYEKIRQYETILDKFQVLDKYTPIINKLASTDIVALTEELKTALSSIQDSVNTIASVIG